MAKGEERSKDPSYITPANFSKVVMDLLRGHVKELGQDHAMAINASLMRGIIPYKPNGEPIDKAEKGITESNANPGTEVVPADSNGEPEEKADEEITVSNASTGAGVVPAHSPGEPVEKAEEGITLSNGNKGAEVNPADSTEKPIDKKEEGTQINPETLRYLQSLWVDSQGDLVRFDALLQQWFTDTMARTEGWYKRQVQNQLFWLGLIVAVLFNVNTIQIARNLSTDKELRAQIVAQAETYVKEHPTLGEDLKKKEEDLEKAKVDTAATVKNTEATNSPSATFFSSSSGVTCDFSFSVDSMASFFFSIVQLFSICLPFYCQHNNVPPIDVTSSVFRSVVFIWRAKIEWLRLGYDVS
jgi:hypothetical protein